MGSLVAALASYLDARHHGGIWRLRIEDIDPPREQQGARLAILKSLEAHQLHWDGDVLYQSQRSDAYREALQQLSAQQLSYRCTCSRQALQNQQQDMLYNGHCRYLNHNTESVAALRINIEKSLQALHLDSFIQFDDLVLGRQQQDLLSEAGDFVIHRKDGLFAYQLAVVVDDIFQQVTHVIRGADLLDATARQILLFRLLKGTDLNLSPLPVFGHVPLVMNPEGQKLSKQNLAPALNDKTPVKNIFNALQLLKQNPPAALAGESLQTLLGWAIAHWQIKPL